MEANLYTWRIYCSVPINPLGKYEFKSRPSHNPFLSLNADVNTKTLEVANGQKKSFGNSSVAINYFCSLFREQKWPKKSTLTIRLNFDLLKNLPTSTKFQFNSYILIDPDTSKQIDIGLGTYWNEDEINFEIVTPLFPSIFRVWPFSATTSVPKPSETEIWPPSRVSQPISVSPTYSFPPKSEPTPHYHAFEAAFVPKGFNPRATVLEKRKKREEKKSKK